VRGQEGNQQRIAKFKQPRKYLLRLSQKPPGKEQAPVTKPQIKSASGEGC